MTPVRSEKYLRHVRQRECCCRSFAGARCGGIMHAHHHGRRGGGGMSIKTTDLHTVTLCDNHHREFHKNGEVYPFDAATTDLLFWQTMVDSLGEALLEGITL